MIYCSIYTTVTGSLISDPDSDPDSDSDTDTDRGASDTIIGILDECDLKIRQKLRGPMAPGPEATPLTVNRPLELRQPGPYHPERGRVPGRERVGGAGASTETASGLDRGLRMG